MEFNSFGFLCVCVPPLIHWLHWPHFCHCSIPWTIYGWTPGLERGVRVFAIWFTTEIRSHAKLRMGAHTASVKPTEMTSSASATLGANQSPSYFNGRHEMCSFQYNLGQFWNRTIWTGKLLCREKKGGNVDHYDQTAVAAHSSKQVHSTDFRQTHKKERSLFVPFLINSSNNHLLSSQVTRAPNPCRITINLYIYSTPRC